MQEFKSVRDEFRDALISVGRDIRSLNEIQEIHSDWINKVHKLTNMALILYCITTLLYVVVLVNFII